MLTSQKRGFGWRASMCALLTALAASCANPLNEATFQRYYQSGLEAEAAGELELARENYRRALINSRTGHLGGSYESAALYQLARMSGFLCDVSAEQLFREAIALEELASGPNSGRLSRRLLEFGRFLAYQGRERDAVAYFERGIPIAEALGVETEDPIGFATVLEEYATVLSAADRQAESAAALQRATAIRELNPGKKASFQSDRYPADCPPAIPS